MSTGLDNDLGSGLPPVDFATIGPRVGDRFPDVALRSHTGDLVDLHAHRSDRPAMVVFHRSADW